MWVRLLQMHFAMTFACCQWLQTGLPVKVSMNQLERAGHILFNSKLFVKYQHGAAAVLCNGSTKMIKRWSLTLSSAKGAGGGERWYGPAVECEWGREGRRGREALGQNHKTIFFPGARKGHLTDAGQNINEVGRRKWL